jgi:Zn-finger nucleic acid-binding protein
MGGSFDDLCGGGSVTNRKRLIKRLDLTVDICLAHGVWFDAGELHRLATNKVKAAAGADERDGGAAARRIDLGVMGRVSGVPPSRDGSGS